jgi:hypothetical protein
VLVPIEPVVRTAVSPAASGVPSDYIAKCRLLSWTSVKVPRRPRFINVPVLILLTELGRVVNYCGSTRNTSLDLD